MVLVLVLAGAFLIAGPHELLHHHPSADCTACFVQAIEAPEPVRLVAPALRFAPLEELPREQLIGDRVWSDSAPRAPPARPV